jgi:hypothetical protein
MPLQNTFFSFWTSTISSKKNSDELTLKIKERIMPLTLTLTEGVLPAGTEKQAVVRITDAMLKRHGLTGNKVMTPNITATIHVLPKSSTFSGGEEFSGAWVEWKVPSFALSNREVQLGFFKDATDIIYDLSGGKQPRDNIYVNVVHAVDGGWNLDGKAMTNAEIGEAIAKG